MWTGPLTLPGELTFKGHIAIRAESTYRSDIFVKLKCRWSNLNNKSNGFIGIGKRRKRVKFSIGRLIPDTEERYTCISESRFIKH